MKLEACVTKQEHFLRGAAFSPNYHDFWQGTVCEQQHSIKYSVKRLKEQETKLDAETLTSKHSNDLKRAVDLSSEKGASLWLTVIAIETHGLHSNLSFEMLYAYNMAGDHFI